MSGRIGLHVARTSTPGRHKFSPISIRIEPNIDGAYVVWRVQGAGLDHVSGLHSDAGKAVGMAAAVAWHMVQGKPPEPILGSKPRLAARDGKKLRKPTPKDDPPSAA